jgi:DNA polymerase-4
MKETHLPVSMGLAVNKLVSQVATGECGPNGQRVVPAGTEEAFLAPLPVQRIPGIGSKTARFLQQMGIERIKTLAGMPLHLLEATFGKYGPALWNIAHGIDHSPVQPFRVRRSVYAETIFETDTIDMGKLKAAVFSMTEQLAFQLRQRQECASCIIVQIRYSDSEAETRRKNFPCTASDHLIARLAMDIFSSLYTRRVSVRRIGIRLAKLVRGNLQMKLFDEREEKHRLFEAVDRIRSRHGAGMVTRACTLDNEPGIRQAFHFSNETGPLAATTYVT